MRSVLAHVRLLVQVRRLDRQLERQSRQTRRELVRLLGPYARPGDGLAPTMRRVPADDRPRVLELLGRVDLGPGRPGVDPDDALYDFLDALGGHR